MRIAYIALHLEGKYVYGGVGRKLQEHCRIWQDMGHTAHLFLLSPDKIDLPGITTFQFGSARAFAPLRLVEKEISRSRSLAALIHAVADFKPDLIYLRYGLFTMPLPRLFQIAPVVMEINTDDINEYRHRGPFFYLLNRLTRGLTFSRASGLVTISGEIARLPGVTKYHLPTLVLPNGIDLCGVEPLPAPGNARPRLAFVGNAGIAWNGVDKLIDFAKKAPDLQIDIIGYAREDIPEAVPDNVVLHGRVNIARVREILAEVDVASGTLALHRKQLEENSALKVREALAFGLPIILAYNDTDITGKGFDFVLQIPNVESNVADNAETIRAFIYCMVGKRADRAAVAPLIDQRAKERHRFAFFEQVLQQRTTEKR